MTHFLQSNPWKQFQEAIGRTVITDEGDGWRYLAAVESGTGNTRLYTPYGPDFTTEEQLDASLTSLKHHAQRRGASFLRIQPAQDFDTLKLQKRGFKQVTYNQLQPTHTQVIDLTVSREALLANMSQNSRNITRNYHKKGITVHTSTDPADISILTSLLSSVASRNNIRTHSAAYFQAQATTLFPLGAATLYYAVFDNHPIAAALVYDTPSTRYYAHAAANDDHRKLSAGTALVGQMILDAKDKNQSSFDLYGITLSDDPSHPWHGFTKFKRSFGGSLVTYSEAWDLPLKPLPYYLYRAYQTLRRRLR